MSAIFAERVRVRAHECDTLGHANNAVYIQYLQQATFDAIGAPRANSPMPVLRKLSIEYFTPALYGDELEIATWVMECAVSGFSRGYSITRPADRASVAGARIEWEGPSGTIPADGGLEHALMPLPLKPFTQPRDNGARPFFQALAVRRYELDSTGSVGVSVYFNWLEEATFRAAKFVGWPLERMRSNDFVTFQFRHDAEFTDAAREGDKIVIESRLIDVRRVRGTWLHEVRRAETRALIMRDYSTGAFLDWAGKVRPAPAGMMEALVRAEPAAE